MFDYEPPEEKRTVDWSGPIIVAVLSPVFFFFAYMGKAELGFTTCIILGMSVLAVKLRWHLRKHGWFWATIVFILALQVPLIFIVRWPQTSVPTIFYSMPLGIVDFLFTMGAISLAQKIFSKGSSAGDE